MNLPQQSTKPVFLLDTGPLSVLCGFPINDESYINLIINHAEILLADDVKKSHSPNNPVILDQAYDKLLGAGERSTIKSALANSITPVIDDKDAFVVACRFGLQPIGFQDFIVQLALNYTMPKQTARQIVQTTARQFPASFLTHTLDLLS